MSKASRARQRERSVMVLAQDRTKSRTLMYAAGLAAGLAIGATVYLRNLNESKLVDVAPAKRQEMLDASLAQLHLPYAMRAYYDPTGDLLNQELIRLAKQYMPTAAADQVVADSIFSTPNDHGMYEASTPDLPNTMGRGEKSNIFFGEKLFSDENFRNLTKDDLKIIIQHEHRHAYQHAKGYAGIDTNWLIDGLLNGSIDRKVYWAACELDANAEQLRVIDAGAKHTTALMDNLLTNLAIDLVPSWAGTNIDANSKKFYNAVFNANRPILEKYNNQISAKTREMMKKYPQ